MKKDTKPSMLRAEDRINTRLAEQLEVDDQEKERTRQKEGEYNQDKERDKDRLDEDPPNTGGSQGSGTKRRAEGEPEDSVPGGDRIEEDRLEDKTGEKRKVEDDSDDDSSDDEPNDPDNLGALRLMPPTLT